MFDDPKALTTANWQDIHVWLQFFWIYFPLVLTFAVTVLTAHAIIPSLVRTGHISPRAHRVRLPMTVFAFGVFIVAAIFGVLVVINALNVGNIWDRWWI